MITIRKQEEMEKYYVKEINAYMFNDNVEFLCDVNVEANIIANNIKACDIRAYDINALDIIAGDINANNISYDSLCYAYDNIECNSIEGRREGAKHFVIQGKLIIKGRE